MIELMRALNHKSFNGIGTAVVGSLITAAANGYIPHHISEGVRKSGKKTDTLNERISP